MALIQRKLSLLYRSFLRELSPIPRAATYSEVLAALCRLLGCAAIVMIALVSIRNARDISAPEGVPFALLVSVVAITVGSLLRDVAFLICAVAVNRFGHDFRASRVALDGNCIEEVFRPDGTWDRYTRGSEQIVHEWRDWDGVCRREVLTRAAQ